MTPGIRIITALQSTCIGKNTLSVESKFFLLREAKRDVIFPLKKQVLIC